MRFSLKLLVVGALAFGHGAACSAPTGVPAVNHDAAVGIGGADGGVGAVRIIRGDPNDNWFSLAIEGHGLATDEGRLVTARIGMADRPPERLGSGQARIEGGAFRIDFPAGCEASLYKRKVLFIDADGDGSCTPGVDRVYADYRFLTNDATLTLIDSLPKPLETVMPLATEQSTAESCQALNESWPES